MLSTFASLALSTLALMFSEMLLSQSHSTVNLVTFGGEISRQKVHGYLFLCHRQVNVEKTHALSAWFSAHIKMVRKRKIVP